MSRHSSYGEAVPIDDDDPRAPYIQIADDLRQAIADGSLATGDKLPSARQIMDEYDVSTTTAQSAFRKLKNEGLTRSVHGRGTFVRSQVATPTGAGDDEPSQEYLDLRDELRALAAAVDDLRHQIDGLLDAQSPPKSPAKKRAAKR